MFGFGFSGLFYLVFCLFGFLKQRCSLFVFSLFVLVFFLSQVSYLDGMEALKHRALNHQNFGSWGNKAAQALSGFLSVEKGWAEVLSISELDSLLVPRAVTTFCPSITDH